MKKAISLVSVIILLCSLFSVSAAAFDPYTVYVGKDGCQLLSLCFTQADNPWLLWDVEFNSLCDGRVLETAKDHPRLVGQAVIPAFAYEGDRAEFNGQVLTQGVAVTLLAENELIVYSGDTRAEYQVTVTEESNGIPVVLIDTDDAPIPDKVNYVDTSVTILGSEVYGGADVYAATGGIKLRGNSTMGYDKKPYRIKFDSKQNVFGLGKAKSWVLLANYLDPAAIRNDVAYSFGARLSAMTAETTGFQVYVPRTRPVEVYLNGEYQGLYDLGDHIQVDSTRIDIDESGDEFDDNGVQLFPEGNVGYYLEIEDGSRVIPEWHNEQAYYVTIENTGGTGTGTLYTGNLSSSGNAETAGTGTLDTLYVQIKTPEVPSEEQIAYIQNYLQTVNDLILAKDETVFDYIDMDGFIDWYLINEVFKNTDSGFLSSVKLFKDKDGKLFMGPVWDFDIGAGAVAYSSIHNPTGWRTRDTERCAWYKSLFEIDSFVAAVEKRWADLHENGILDGIFSDIDGLTAYLRASADDNYALWHDSYVTAVNNTSWLTVPDLQLTSNHWIEQVQYLRAYMTGRIAWLDEQFGYTEASGPAYVNMLSSTLTSTSSSKTFTINKSFPVQELSNLYLSVYSRSAFDITFNFDVGSPSLSSDWQGSDPLLPFQGTTGENIAAGTYTNVELNLENYMPWSNDPTATTVTLESIVVKTSGNRRNVQISGLYAAKEVQADVSGSSKTPLGGKVFVAGAPEYEQTLRADTLGVTPYGADVTYQWYENGTAISGATSSTYTPASTQIGSAFTVAVTGSGDYEGTLLSEPVTLQKATYTYKTSQIPELISKTHNTLVILERENYEISVDGVNWQTSGTFENLQPNTLYRVLYRHGETASQTGGTAGEALRVITDVDPNAPEEEEPDPTPVTPGDVNLDGYVNTSDVKRILKHALGTAVLTGDALTAADFDGDGQATTNDARALLKSLVSA